MFTLHNKCQCSPLIQHDESSDAASKMLNNWDSKDHWHYEYVQTGFSKICTNSSLFHNLDYLPIVRSIQQLIRPQFWRSYRMNVVSTKSKVRIIFRMEWACGRKFYCLVAVKLSERFRKVIGTITEHRWNIKKCHFCGTFTKTSPQKLPQSFAKLSMKYRKTFGKLPLIFNKLGCVGIFG